MFRVKFIIIIAVMVSLFLASCITGKKVTQSSQTIERLADTVKLQSGSLIYSLPRTVFTVRVGLEKTTMIPGPYAAYAGDMIGLKEVVTGRKDHWRVKSIFVDSHQEADPSEYFVIHSTGIISSNVIALKKEGLILDLNPSENHQDESPLFQNEVNVSHFISSDLGSDEYFEVETDTAFRRVKVDSSFIRIPYTVEKKKILSTDELAQKAAKRLMEIRDGKVLILAGEATVYPQSEAPIRELNKMEKEYTELFTGKVFTETYYYNVQIIPEKESPGKPVTLFWLSESEGPLAKSNTAIPVIAEIIPEQKTRDITIIENDPVSQSSSAGKLFYRIPDVASFKVTMQGKTLYNSRKLVCQLGEVMQLPSNYIIGK